MLDKININVFDNEGRVLLNKLKVILEKMPKIPSLILDIDHNRVPYYINLDFANNNFVNRGLSDKKIGTIDFGIDEGNRMNIDRDIDNKRYITMSKI